MAVYADRARMELVFGRDNVKKWADANNNLQEAEITARIDWALQAATDDIDSRLLLGYQTIPFATIPNLIIDLTAKLAGAMLYVAPRGMVDVDDSVFALREEIEETIRRIQAGQIKFDLTTVAAAPMVVNFSDDPTIPF